MTTATLPRFTVHELCIGLAGIAALSLAANFKVPLAPVPLSLQTLAVGLLAFGLMERRQAASVIVTYVALAFIIGRPVAAGQVTFTGGYLLGYIAMAAFIGWAWPLARTGNWTLNVFTAFALAVMGHALVYLPGILWLHTALSLTNESQTFSQSLTAGAMPFLAGDLIKSAILALAATAWAHRR